MAKPIGQKIRELRLHNKLTLKDLDALFLRGR